MLEAPSRSVGEVLEERGELSFRMERDDGSEARLLNSDESCDRPNKRRRIVFGVAELGASP
jgi:hypothetical protein